MSNKSASIDALRGCAIFAVLQFHYGELGLNETLGIAAPIRKFLGFGWAGVDLFFVLSAFLLTRNLLAHRGEVGTAEVFYRRRILRILPLYLLLLSAALAMIPILGRNEGQIGEWLLGGLAPLPLYALFLQNFWDGLQAGWSGHFLAPTWSLAVEEHFYLVLPLLVLRLDDRRLAQAAALFILVAPLLRFALDAEVGPIAARTWTFARVDSFGWGMLVALALSYGEAGAELFLRLWSAGAAVILASFVGAAVFCNSLVDPLLYSITALLAARLLLSTARPSTFETPSGAIFNCAAWMGRRCYSIYLLHMPVIGLVAIAAGSPHFLHLGACFFFLAAALTFLLADMTFRFIERPFMAYAERHVLYAEPGRA